jgi:hypothetical protein
VILFILLKCSFCENHIDLLGFYQSHRQSKDRFISTLLGTLVPIMFPCGAKTSKKKSQNIENKCLVLKNHNTP